MTPAPQRDGMLTAIKLVLEIVVVAIFVVTFLLQPFRIPSESMEPTLLVGDFLMADKQSFAPAGVMDKLLPPARIRRGDLVIFHDPVFPDPASAETAGDGRDLSQGPTHAAAHLVKRVIGLPGDRLRLRGGRVLLGGVALDEPYAFYSPAPSNNFRDEFHSLREADPNVQPEWWVELRRSVAAGELVIPPNRYFVMGDNRNDSEDSRYWGFVSGDQIIGRPLVVYFSLRADPAANPAKSLWARLRDELRIGLHSIRFLR